MITSTIFKQIPHFFSQESKLGVEILKCHHIEIKVPEPVSS